MDGLRDSIPTPTTPRRARTSRIRTRRRSASRTTGSSSGCWPRRSTGPPSLARRCRSSTTSSGSSRSSPRQEGPLLGDRADDDAAGRRANRRPRTTTSGFESPSASRTVAGHPALPFARRASALQLAVGRVLRGRDAESESHRGPGLARSNARRLDRRCERARRSTSRRLDCPLPGPTEFLQRHAATSASAARSTAPGSWRRSARRRAPSRRRSAATAGGAARSSRRSKGAGWAAPPCGSR